MTGYESDGDDGRRRGGLVTSGSAIAKTSPPQLTGGRERGLQVGATTFREGRRETGASVATRSTKADPLDLSQRHGAAMDYRVVEVPLCHLYFYQSVIAGHFSDGRSLQSTVDALRSGAITSKDIPLAHTMLAGRRLYCLGTRRLACFHLAWKHARRRVPKQYSRRPASIVCARGMSFDVIAPLRSASTVLCSDRPSLKWPAITLW
eukprot:gene48907-63384_t